MSHIYIYIYIYIYIISGGWIYLLPHVEVKGTYYMNRLVRVYELIIRVLLNSILLEYDAVSLSSSFSTLFRNVGNGSLSDAASYSGTESSATSCENVNTRKKFISPAGETVF
jgi:hypothetical protein